MLNATAIACKEVKMGLEGHADVAGALAGVEDMAGTVRVDVTEDDRAPQRGIP